MALRPARRRGSTDQLDYGCGRDAAGLEAATGQEMGRVFHDHYHSYGLLMDSFESVTANVVKKAS